MGSFLCILGLQNVLVIGKQNGEMVHNTLNVSQGTLAFQCALELHKLTPEIHWIILA